MKLYTVTCLVFAVFVPRRSITEVIGSGVPNNPAPPPASAPAPAPHKGGWYENEFHSMQQDLNQLKVSLTQKNDQECIGRLDSSLVKMKDYLEVQHRETVSKSEKIENLLDTLTHATEKVRKELDELRGHYEKEGGGRGGGGAGGAGGQQVAPDSLPAGCVNDIRSKNFAAAGEKLHKITELDHIKLIVKDVYDRQPANFDLVLHFADSIGTRKKAYLVYKALISEMESNGHEDVLKTLKLVESIDRKVIRGTANGEESETGTEEEAQYSVFRMKNKVKIVAAEKIKDAILHDTMKNEEVQKISRCIHEFSHDLFQGVMKMAVTQTYPKLPASKILESIKCYGQVEQLISAYLAVYDVIMENDRSGNSVSLFSLAEHTKATMDMKNYPLVSHDRRCTFEGLKYRLPKSVRNIVFLPKVCFKNIVLNEYLFAGSNYTEEKRFVYSWLPQQERDVKDIGVWGTWITTYEHGTFDIYNVHNKEFLYADLAGHDDQRRFVFTWSGHKKKLPSSSRWLLVPDGDHVLVQNAETKEYLYADPEKRHDAGKHHVFTLKSGSATKESIWFAENCVETRPSPPPPPPRKH